MQDDEMKHCLECVCHDLRGSFCDIDQLCGNIWDCNLLGVPLDKWKNAGEPKIKGIPDVDLTNFGKQYSKESNM